MAPQPLRHHSMYESDTDSRPRLSGRSQSARSIEICTEDWPQHGSTSGRLDDADEISTAKLCCMLMRKSKTCVQLILMALCAGILLIYWSGTSMASITQQISSTRVWTLRPEQPLAWPAATQPQQVLMEKTPAVAFQPAAVAPLVEAATIQPSPPPSEAASSQYVAWSVNAQKNLMTDAPTADFVPASAPELVEPAQVRLPDGFDWQAYLYWNADLQKAGLTTREQAEAHFLENGHTENRMHKPAKVTLRYSACGGLFNQHYCHLSAIMLAIVLGAQEVIWPPMLERASFANRFSTDSRGNKQTWRYVDAQSLWDLPTISKNLQDGYNLTITKHPAHCPMPDFANPATAYQLCSMPPGVNMIVPVSGEMYSQAYDPQALRSAVLLSIQEVWLRGASLHPTSVLIDLPCTLFMMEFRKTEMVEDVAKCFAWAPSMQALANKVISSIKKESNDEPYNGIHLRMEKDAADWASMTGGMKNYWREYKDAMVKARFNVNPRVLYIASGLLKSSKGPDHDPDAEAQMKKLSKDIVDLKFATSIVYKEKYLSDDQLRNVLNEQSALIDYLVLKESSSFVGVGMSTFSFYLQEERIMAGVDPHNTSLLMLPAIGTDELFYSAAVVAIRTRKTLAQQNKLHDVCRRVNMEPCFAEEQNPSP